MGAQIGWTTTCNEACFAPLISFFITRTVVRKNKTDHTRDITKWSAASVVVHLFLSHKRKGLIQGSCLALYGAKTNSKSGTVCQLFMSSMKRDFFVHNTIYTLTQTYERLLLENPSLCFVCELHYYRTFLENLETFSAFLLANKQMHLTLLCCLATSASPWFLYMKNQHAANLETYRVQCE